MTAYHLLQCHSCTLLVAAAAHIAEEQLREVHRQEREILRREQSQLYAKEVERLSALEHVQPRGFCRRPLALREHRQTKKLTELLHMGHQLLIRLAEAFCKGRVRGEVLGRNVTRVFRWLY